MREAGGSEHGQVSVSTETRLVQKQVQCGGVLCAMTMRPREQGKTLGIYARMRGEEDQHGREWRERRPEEEGCPLCINYVHMELMLTTEIWGRANGCKVPAAGEHRRGGGCGQSSGFYPEILVALRGSMCVQCLLVVVCLLARVLAHQTGPAAGRGYGRGPPCS